MQNNKKWFEFVARYQGDAEFARQVDADPTGQARAFGLAIPEGSKLKLVRNTPDEVNVVIPHRNLDSMSEEELGSVAGGYCIDCTGTPPGGSGSI